MCLGLQKIEWVWYKFAWAAPVALPQDDCEVSSFVLPRSQEMYDIWVTRED